MTSPRIEDMLERYAKAPKETKKDQKAVWVERMMKSARKYYKRCPYFDHKTKMCFITLGEKCTREGKYDGCSVFLDFLKKKYDEYTSKGRPLPTDFLDISITII